MQLILSRRRVIFLPVAAFTTFSEELEVLMTCESKMSCSWRLRLYECCKRERRNWNTVPRV